MVNRRRGGEKAQADELGNDPGQVGPDSAGQSGDPQRLSPAEEATNESVEQLAEEEQSLEAAAVEGIEDAADHPERPAHTHIDYGRPDDGPERTDSQAPRKPSRADRSSQNVEDLPDGKTRKQRS